MSPKGSKSQSPELLRVFGSRLREERVRLGYTQEELALIGGVTRRSQILYESGTHSPAVEYLIRVAEAGVLTGHLLQSQSTFAYSNPAPDSMTADEVERFLAEIPLPQLLRIADAIFASLKDLAIGRDLRHAVADKAILAIIREAGRRDQLRSIA